MTDKHVIFGTILMLLGIIGVAIVLFEIDWTLCVLFCAYVFYKMGKYLATPKNKMTF